jgi:hypothetical protein
LYPKKKVKEEHEILNSTETDFRRVYKDNTQMAQCTSLLMFLHHRLWVRRALDDIYLPKKIKDMYTRTRMDSLKWEKNWGNNVDYRSLNHKLKIIFKFKRNWLKLIWLKYENWSVSQCPTRVEQHSYDTPTICVGKLRQVSKIIIFFLTPTLFGSVTDIC